MSFLFIFTLAAVMAIFGAIGYYRGSWATLVALLFLLMGMIAVVAFGDTILSLLNGLYIGIMLVFKSGLSDIAAGDLDSAAAKLETVERPFTGETEALGLALVVGGAAAIGLLIGTFMKHDKSVLGGILGLLYGYLLTAVFAPVLLGVPESLLPIPILRPPQPGVAPATVTTTAGSGGLSALLETLSQPETIQIVATLLAVVIAVFLIVSVRRSSKRG